MNDSDFGASSAGPQDPDFASQLLSLLRELENSLRSSHHALLARDVGQLEELTLRQSHLQGALSDLCGNPAQLLSGELREAQFRVLHLARVQRAILVRRNRGLTMLAHLIAGTRASYEFSAQDTISLHPAPPASPEA